MINFCVNNVIMMSWNGGFYCTYCGKIFGDNPGKLALHIRDFHEKNRGKHK